MLRSRYFPVFFFKIPNWEIFTNSITWHKDLRGNAILQTARTTCQSPPVSWLVGWLVCFPKPQLALSLLDDILIHLLFSLEALPPQFKLVFFLKNKYFLVNCSSGTVLPEWTQSKVSPVLQKYNTPFQPDYRFFTRQALKFHHFYWIKGQSRRKLGH